VKPQAVKKDGAKGQAPASAGGLEGEAVKSGAPKAEAPNSEAPTSAGGLEKDEKK
jgi:hypothetical protein